MARIVLLKDKDPLVISKEEMEDDKLFICRCGLSADWPLCDSSHALARKEEEGTTYVHHRPAPDAQLQTTTTTEDPSPYDPRPRGGD